MPLRKGPHILVTGVCGTGMSSLAARLAHLAAGRPLGDADRWPWPDAIAIAANVAGQSGAEAIACSALRRRYRHRLRMRLGEVLLIHLAGAPALIRARLEGRRDHFMPPALLDSQLDELEPPTANEPHLIVDAALSPQAQDAQMRAFLAGQGLEPGERT